MSRISSQLQTKIERARQTPKKWILIIVCVALLLDNMLYMVIVPIIPVYLEKIGAWNTKKPNTFSSNITTFTTSSTTSTTTTSKPTTTTTTTTTSTIPMIIQPQYVNYDYAYRYPPMVDPNFYQPPIHKRGKREANFTDDARDHYHYKPSKGLAKLFSKLPPPPMKLPEKSHDAEDLALGTLFASKAAVQLIVNPFSGSFIDRVGYDFPMLIGLVIIFISTAFFAFGSTYGVLFFARSFQGVGSAFADTSGLAMLADQFIDENERNRALGIAIAFISFGSLAAPPFGGILYQFLGKQLPFIFLAILALLDGVLLVFIVNPNKLKSFPSILFNYSVYCVQKVVYYINRIRGVTTDQPVMNETNYTDADNGIPDYQPPTPTPMRKLLMDPYILACAGALVMANVSLSFIEPTITVWMRDTMDANPWEMGFIWLPAFFPHVISIYIAIKFCERYPHLQWLLAAVGLIIEGLMCFIIPFARNIYAVSIPICGLCFGMGLVDTAILPMLSNLVDARHTPVYGSVYAIADISYSIAYAFGPVLAGWIVAKSNFLTLNLLICAVNIGYAPVMLTVRKFHAFKPNLLPNEETNLVANESYKQEYNGKDVMPPPIPPAPIMPHDPQQNYINRPENFNYQNSMNPMNNPIDSMNPMNPMNSMNSMNPVNPIDSNHNNHINSPINYTTNFS
ncbi:hypothetical protein SNEBB_003581 [Seison nebaliae]|nr:hypothetical protein SNEBB_003581 [Seison nebaliae]